PNFGFFLGARLLQSFGGGGIFIIASSYVISTYTKKKQGSMLGMIGGMHGIASVIGPGLGSFIIDFTSTWHWLFFINVPIGIILLFFFKRNNSTSFRKHRLFMYYVTFTFYIDCYVCD